MSLKHDDGTIDSWQRVELSGDVPFERLEPLYWSAVRRTTFGAARFSRGAIRFVGVWPVLIRFGPSAGGRRTIAGGLFAARPGGTIQWEAIDGHASVSVKGFAPLLRGPLWRLQTHFHTAVGRRYFARLAQEER